jgi:hypothetical protein
LQRRAVSELSPGENGDARGLGIENRAGSQQNLSREFVRQVLDDAACPGHGEGDFERCDFAQAAGFGDVRGLVGTLRADHGHQAAGHNLF